MSTQPDRIAELAAGVAALIPTIFDEGRDSITEAATAAVEAAQEDPDGKKQAVVSLPITVKWSLDGGGYGVALAVTVKRKYESTGTLTDPNQPKLPGV